MTQKLTGSEIRKKYIEFFKNKFTIENMEKFVNIDLDKEDFIFYCNNTDIEFKNNKIKEPDDDIEE